jgi:hypothetical protein
MKRLPVCTVLYLEAVLEVLPKPTSFKIFRRQCINRTIKTKETACRIKNPVLSRLIVGFLNN